jgi:hypothetical protein
MAQRSAFPLRRLNEKVSPECLTGRAGDCAVHGPERFRANCAFGGNMTGHWPPAALSHDNLKACERIQANGKKIHSDNPDIQFFAATAPLSPMPVPIICQTRELTEVSCG